MKEKNMNSFIARASSVTASEPFNTFTDFEVWKKAATAKGGKIRRVTVSNYNTYYQATVNELTIGFFNSREGKKGKDPSWKPGGVLAKP